MSVEVKDVNTKRTVNAQITVLENRGGEQLIEVRAVGYSPHRTVVREGSKITVYLVPRVGLL